MWDECRHLFNEATYHQLRGQLLQKEPLFRYTSWQVGGVADWLYRPADVADLSFFLKSLPIHVPLYWLGAGTNLLVRDGGVRGVVITVKHDFKQIVNSKSCVLYAEAGLCVSQLAQFAANNYLAGLEFLAGIPGTLGGVLIMNAGAHQSEIWNFVTRVRTIDRLGNIHERMPSDYQIGYRQVIAPKEEWFVGGCFHLERGNQKLSRKKMKALLAKRRAAHPLEFPNAGSVFRNPPGQSAWKLIEQCGLKGYRVGGACVSEKHANFIINDRSATASDIERIIEHVKQTVWIRFGIKLKHEIKIIGEKSVFVVS
jgi:UDP-N-acetylmuramate dehydrogenase